MTKRTLLSIALATTTAFSVVACGSDTAEEASTAASSAIAEVTSAADPTSSTAASTSVATSSAVASASASASDSSAPAMPGDVITAETDPEFAALLNTNDNCSQALADFAAANAGKTVQFDGYVANIVPSDAGGQRVLVNQGAFDPAVTPMGPSFQYAVGSTGDMNITAGDASEIQIGHGGTFTAKLGQFDAQSCLLSLEPVSTVLN